MEKPAAGIDVRALKALARNIKPFGQYAAERTGDLCAQRLAADGGDGLPRLDRVADLPPPPVTSTVLPVR